MMASSFLGYAPCEGGAQFCVVTQRGQASIARHRLWIRRTWESSMHLCDLASKSVALALSIMVLGFFGLVSKVNFFWILTCYQLQSNGHEDVIQRDHVATL